MAKELKKFQAKVEERVSKKGTTYKVLMVEVNGVWKDVAFVDNEMEYALYKAGIRF